MSGHVEAGNLLEQAEAMGIGFEVLAKPIPPVELLTKLAKLRGSP